MLQCPQASRWACPRQFTYGCTWSVAKAPGGGLLGISVRPGCAIFQGIAFAYFFKNRVSKEGKFSGAGCQNMSKEEILLEKVIIQSNFCVFEYTVHRFFPEQGII